MTHAAAPTVAEPQVVAPRANLGWLSVMRVLAITGVITIHTVGFNAIEPDARETLRGTLAIYLDLGATCAVPLFVMMSGVTLLDPTRYQGPGPFLRKRALRLVPPLVFWHLWYFVIVQDRVNPNYGPRQVAALIMNGNLYTALYFFWIVAGLALVSPLLVPYIASVSRRGVLVAGTLLAAIPALSMATREIRGVGVISVDTPWTWWIPYVGLYLLGQGLKDVVIRRWWLLLLASAASVFLFWLHGWSWKNPETPAWLVELSPPSYYSVLSIVYSVLVFLVIKSLVQPDGLLRVLTRGWVARVFRTLGDATLGVFGLHLTILWVVQHHHWMVPGTTVHWWPADGMAATGTLRMAARLAVVWGVTYAIVLVGRRIPFVRAVL